VKKRDEGTIERAAGMLRAAGDSGRMHILASLLADGELSVSELAERSETDPSTTSHRLRVLLSESLVTRRAEGRSRLYSLADRHVRTLVENTLDHADRSVTLK